MLPGSATKNEIEVIHKVPHAEIIFHGSLAKFGSFRGRVGTPASLLQSAFILRPGLRQAIVAGEFKIYRGEIIPGKEQSEETLNLRLGVGQKIHIVPVAKGSKGKGGSIGKTIAGAVIAVAAVAVGVATAGAGTGVIAALGSTAFGIGGASVSFGAIAAFGALLMMGGIAGLVGVKTKKNTNNTDSSTTLGGTQNVGTQGGCIPLIYGRNVRTGSVVISLGYGAQAWSNTDGKATDNPSGMIDKDTVTDITATGSFNDLANKVGTGSKGKGNSGGSHETPNNLRSKAVVKIIDLIGQGPGVELVTGPGEEGAKSIFFNGTPLMAPDGTYNFAGVKWAWRNGSADQEPVPGFPAAEETVKVGTKVPYQLPVTQTITSETATSANVVVSFPALYHTNQKTGVLGVGPDVNIVIDVRPAGGDWTNVVNDTLSGKKCISTYEQEYNFQLPGAETGITSWDVRVSRNTPDSTSAGDASDFYFESIDIITDHLLVYPNCAYCALIFDSSVFGDSIPDRSFAVTGKEIRVPANYDPDTRTYATTGTGTQGGTWDGISWKVAKACDDPCWAFLDVIASHDYGFGISESKFGSLEADLYEASQYACVRIDDGFGGKECRYSLNVCITQAGDSFKVLGQFTSVFRALAYWTNGGIAISADMPREPVMLVTNANVVDGSFSYEGTALSGRHNIAYCTYTNQQNTTSFEDLECYTDDPSIITTGARSTKIEGFGCTSRGSALRQAHWVVDTELHQTQTVTYQCGVDHAAVRPGEIIQIADVNKMGGMYGGRVGINSTETLIYIDREIQIDTSLQYSLKVIMDDGSVEARLVDQFQKIESGEDTLYAVTLKDALPAIPSANTIWILTEPTAHDAPQFRVLLVQDKGKGVYQITAINHDPAKFDRVEKNLPFNEIKYSDLPNLLPSPLPAPSNVSVQDYTVGQGTTTIIRTDVGWTQSSDARIMGYNVRAVNSANGSVQIYDAKDTGLYSIDNLDASSYVFGVRSYGKNGTVSSWVDSAAINIDGKPQAPDAVLALTAIGGTRCVTLTWQQSTIRNVLDYEVQRAPDANGVPGTFSTITYVAATSYTDTDSKNLMPSTTWWYRVRVRDTYQTVGVWSSPVSAKTTYLLTDDLEKDIRNTASVAKALLNDIGTPKVVEGNSLPAPNNYPENSVIDYKGVLYKKRNGSWQQMVAGVTVDKNGKVYSDQLTLLSTDQVTQELAQKQIDLLTQASQDSSLTADEQAAISNALATGDASQELLNLAQYVVSQQSKSGIGNLTLDKIPGKLTAEQISDLTLANLGGGLTSEQQASIDLANTTGKIKADQIDAASVRTAILTAGSIVAGMVATDAISADNIQASAITTTKIAANAVTADQIDVGSIRTAILQANTVGAEQIIAGSIDATKVNAQSLQAAILTAGSVTAATIAGGAVTGDKIAGNTITGNNIAGSAITADKLAVGSPNNMIQNSCFDPDGAGATGWNTWADNVSSALYPNYSSWGNSPSSNSCGWLCVPDYGSLNNNTRLGAYPLNIQTGNNQLPATPKITYCFSVYVGPNAFHTRCTMCFYDVNGNLLLNRLGSYFTSNGNAKDISTYARPFVMGTAPSGTAFVAVWVECWNLTGSTMYNGPGVSITQAQLAIVTSGTTTPPAWCSGYQTTIDGRGVKAGTITADKIVAKGITAAQIQVGAIGTDQLAAHAITADKLAVTELIVSQAQIGNLVVGTSNMQDNSITNLIEVSGFSSNFPRLQNINQLQNGSVQIVNWGTGFRAPMNCILLVSIDKSNNSTIGAVYFHLYRNGNYVQTKRVWGVGGGSLIVMWYVSGVVNDTFAINLNGDNEGLFYDGMVMMLGRAK